MGANLSHAVHRMQSSFALPPSFSAPHLVDLEKPPTLAASPSFPSHNWKRVWPGSYSLVSDY